MQDRTRIYVDGNWVNSAGSERIEVENPATEQVIATVPSGTSSDVDSAVRAAHAAFDRWSRTSASERAGYLRALRDGLQSRTDAIAETIATEVGSPMRIATKIQASLPPTVVGNFADLLEEETPQEWVGNSLVLREPVGVVGSITPWNYPLHQITNKLAAALAAGCTVVIKPSEIAPLVAYQLMDAVHEAGFPPGVVNFVPGYGSVVGEAIAAHEDIDAVSFTGSTRAGRRVSELAAGTVKKVSLELGGKSPNVILDDAELDTPVKVGVANAFLNSGQTCTALTRMLVHRDQYEQALDLAGKYAAAYAPGDPLDKGTKLGPLVSAAQRERVRGYIRTGLAEGARLVTGGADAPAGFDRGYYVAPTVLGDVKPDDTVAQEEIFGPVLSVLPYEDEREALEIANNSQYGLAGAVWSGDQERATEFARHLRTGSIDVNGGAYNPNAPFGGYKHSGLGREMGRHGLEEFLEVKSLQL